MNAVREAVPQATPTHAAQTLTQRPQARSHGESAGSDPRQIIADRYPAGLISDAELEALLDTEKP